MIPLNTTLEVLPIEVIEEREQVEGEFDPALPLAFVQRVRVHDARGVVEAGAAHHGSIHVPRKGHQLHSFHIDNNYSVIRKVLKMRIGGIPPPV